MEYVITFKNTNLVIKAEQTLIRANIDVAVMPLPTIIKAGCGLCLRISQQQIDMALEKLAENKVEHSDIYIKDYENNKPVFYKAYGEDI